MEPIAEIEDDEEAFETFDPNAPNDVVIDPLTSIRSRKLRNSPLDDCLPDSPGSTMFRSRSNTWPQFNYEDSSVNEDVDGPLDESEIIPHTGHEGMHFFETSYDHAHSQTGSNPHHSSTQASSHYHSTALSYHSGYSSFYSQDKEDVPLDTNDTIQPSQQLSTSASGGNQSGSGSSAVLSSLLNDADDAMDMSDIPSDSLGPNGTPTPPNASSKKNSSRRNAWGNMSYADLITQAINGAPERRLTLSQIYEWMVKNINYFKDKGDSNSSAGWKNSIRHNLSLHNRFIRVQNEGTGKSSWWMINPDAKPGKAARRRAISMETQNYEKRRGRVRRHVDRLRAQAAFGMHESDAGYITPSSTGSILSLVGRSAAFGSIHSGSATSLMLSSTSTAGPSSCYSKLGDSASSLLLSPNTSLSNLCINDPSPLNEPNSRRYLGTPTSPEPYETFTDRTPPLMNPPQSHSGFQGFGSISEEFRSRTGSNASSSNSGSAIGVGSEHHQITPQTGWTGGVWPQASSSTPANSTPVFYSRSNSVANETEMGTDQTKSNHISPLPSSQTSTGSIATELLSRSQQTTQTQSQHNKQSPVHDVSTAHPTPGSDLYSNGPAGVSPTPNGDVHTSESGTTIQKANTNITARQISPANLHAKLPNLREINNNHQLTSTSNVVSGTTSVYDSGFHSGYQNQHKMVVNTSESHSYNAFSGLDHMQLAKMSLGTPNEASSGHNVYETYGQQHSSQHHSPASAMGDSYFYYSSHLPQQNHNLHGPNQHEFYHSLEYHYSDQQHVQMTSHSAHGHHSHSGQSHGQQSQEHTQSGHHQNQGSALEFDFDSVCPGESMMMLECDVNQVIEHELSVDDGALDFDHNHHNQHTSQGAHSQHHLSTPHPPAHQQHQSTSPVQRDLSSLNDATNVQSPEQFLVRSNSSASRSSQCSQISVNSQQHQTVQQAAQQAQQSTANVNSNTNVLLASSSASPPTPTPGVMLNHNSPGSTIIGCGTPMNNTGTNSVSPIPRSNSVSSNNANNIKTNSSAKSIHTENVIARLQASPQQLTQQQQPTALVSAVAQQQPPPQQQQQQSSPSQQTRILRSGPPPYSIHINEQSNQQYGTHNTDSHHQTAYPLSYDSTGQLHHIYPHHQHHSNAESEQTGSASPSVGVSHQATPLATRPWVH